MYYLQSKLPIHNKIATTNMEEKDIQTCKYFLDMTCNRKEYFLLHALYNTHNKFFFLPFVAPYHISKFVKVLQYLLAGFIIHWKR